MQSPHGGAVPSGQAAGANLGASVRQSWGPDIKHQSESRIFRCCTLAALAALVGVHGVRGVDEQICRAHRRLQCRRRHHARHQAE